MCYRPDVKLVVVALEHGPCLACSFPGGEGLPCVDVKWRSMETDEQLEEVVRESFLGPQHHEDAFHCRMRKRMQIPELPHPVSKNRRAGMVLELEPLRMLGVVAPVLKLGGSSSAPGEVG